MTGSVRGLPYPTGTDRVVDGDNAIRALAEAIDERPFFITGGSATIGTALKQFALAPIEDPFAMVDATTGRVTIPTGFGGLWMFTARMNQSGTGAVTGQMRRRAPEESVALIDGRTGAAGAAAAPALHGIIRCAAGEQFDLVAVAASGSVAMSLFYPYWTGYFLRA